MAAIQMTPEQFQQLLDRVQVVPQPQVVRNRHFTHCQARFDRKRAHAAVTEFITAASLYKDMENITDEDAIAGLPLLLTGEANQWWNGVKNQIHTWREATELLREAFAPRRPNHRLFLDIFNNPQDEKTPTDKFITVQRERLAQMTRDLDEEWQLDIIYGLLRYYIRDKIARSDCRSFAELLDKSRIVEENERETRVRNHAPETPENGQTFRRREFPRIDRRPRPRCDFCKNFGHETQECRRKTQDQRRPANDQEIIRCYGCQRPGVFRRNCPNCNSETRRTNLCAARINSRAQPTIDRSQEILRDMQVPPLTVPMQIDDIRTFSAPSPARDFSAMEYMGADAHSAIGNEKFPEIPRITFSSLQLPAEKGRTFRKEKKSRRKGRRKMRKPFVLTTDSSYVRGVAPLQGEATNELPVKYGSRLFTSTERKYTVQSRRPAHEYQPRDQVLVVTHPRINARKGVSAQIAPKYEGPYFIRRPQGPTSHKVYDAQHPQASLGFYHTPFHGSTTPTPAPVAPLRKRGRLRKQVQDHSRDALMVLRGRL
ncbi:hypothetical protein Zmor_006738 [Zophobas morio]|uniref:CCHC-type domain-containing protein n=1 Tax=Zophobas morio TaxID=2755281 RepID=A0AA38ISS4_9CUCU|nr:hypothetical protein Zmor_006738 [Zophobas morio]